jgi:hypothetical protein
MGTSIVHVIWTNNNKLPNIVIRNAWEHRSCTWVEQITTNSQIYFNETCLSHGSFRSNHSLHLSLALVLWPFAGCSCKGPKAGTFLSFLHRCDWLPLSFSSSLTIWKTRYILMHLIRWVLLFRMTGTNHCYHFLLALLFQRRVIF